jgi:hypothetical protein
MKKTCIVCGKELDVLFPDINTNNHNITGGVTDIITASYGSKFDGLMLEITICDDCLENKLENKII